MFMNGKTSTGSAVWWNVGFALCLVGVALSAPRWNWIFSVVAVAFKDRTLVIVAESYSSSKRSGHAPDEPPCERIGRLGLSQLPIAQPPDTPAAS